MALRFHKPCNPRRALEITIFIGDTGWNCGAVVTGALLDTKLDNGVSEAYGDVLIHKPYLQGGHK